MMKKTNRRKILFFALGFAILGWMVIESDPYALWQNISAMRWWILSLVAIWGLGYILNAASWSVIIQTIASPGWRSGNTSHPLSFGRILQFTVSGFAINYITPFGLLGGEPYRVWALRPYIGLERATSSVLLYLMMHVCSHFFFWIAACLASLLCWNFETGFLLILCAIAVIMLMLILLFFRGYRNGMVCSFFTAVSRWPLIGKRAELWKEKNQASLSRIDEGIATLLQDHPKAFWKSMVLEIVSRLVNCLEIAVILQLLAPDLCSMSDNVHRLLFASLFIVAFSSLFANILFFSPLQMGTREGGIFLAMRALWPASAVASLMPLAVSVSMLTRIREFFWITAGLLLAFFAHFNYKKQ